MEALLIQFISGRGVLYYPDTIEDYRNVLRIINFKFNKKELDTKKGYLFFP